MEHVCAYSLHTEGVPVWNMCVPTAYIMIVLVYANHKKRNQSNKQRRKKESKFETREVTFTVYE